jgi:hypothetical protein
LKWTTRILLNFVDDLHEKQPPISPCLLSFSMDYSVWISMRLWLNIVCDLLYRNTFLANHFAIFYSHVRQYILLCLLPICGIRVYEVIKKFQDSFSGKITFTSTTRNKVWKVLANQNQNQGEEWIFKILQYFYYSSLWEKYRIFLLVSRW